MPKASRKPAKKAYPLRLDNQILDALQIWADDELRSLNAQIEYILRDGLRRAGRIEKPASPSQHNIDEG